MGRPGLPINFNEQAICLFKTLVNQEVIIELKNDLKIRGNLHSVDQFLNIKLSNIQVLENEHSYLGCVSNCFIRGSTVRYVTLPPNEVDTDVLEEATRRELMHKTNE